MLLFLLLMLTLNVSGKAAVINLKKTVGREPNAVPVCSNSTDSIITLVVCKISMRSGNDCQLFYQHNHDFENKCDSRVRLMKEIQTIFLDLTNLTPTDGGNYTCECSHLGGTEELHLNVTVRVPERKTTNNFEEKFFITPALGAGVIAVILTGVLLGCICRKINHCKRRRPDPTPASPVTEHVEDIEPYSTFTQRENELYSIAVMPNRMNNSPRLTRV
ncbi:uncharacterized protein LOC110001002 [Xyrichtys novacula]|uniref:Uncharacterized protein LOC110001002 n=1 Tax=Xyrichtys novacula TaxID=13765 RepID=A0AAV1HNC0_XYRNO|nr:uncharacterized protein LOC110001002 [Xyrichtys novacula]